MMKLTETSIIQSYNLLAYILILNPKSAFLSLRRQALDL